MRSSCLLLAAMFCAPAFAAEEAEYAKPDLLIEAADLTQRLGDQPRLLRNKTEKQARENPPETLLDVRPKKDFQAGTILTARHVDVADWKRAFNEGRDADAWRKRLEVLLLGDDSTVIVFDQGVTPNAARAWWILKYWGVKDVRILNGGMKAWRASGGQTGPPMAMQTRITITVTPNPDRLATAKEVIACISKDDDETCLIDTRTTREHQAGAIPLACHSNWTEYVDRRTGKMRSAGELGKLLDKAGFSKNNRTIAYCQSGGRASVVAFATELMGGKRVENYFGSWGEWSKLPDAPVAKPNAPSAAP